jgi:RHS repeat-associated protein
MNKLLCTFAVICLTTNLIAQQNENIASPGDTFNYKKLPVVETENDRSDFHFPYVAPQKQATQTTRASNPGTGETPGFLSVSLTGAATYDVPIAVPQGIKGIAPEISIRYNSQSGAGVAGYGWNLGGLSVISRIPSTQYHDNKIDAVDFDTSDRFALDGQRLIVKTGTYGGDGAVYETENYSKLKIVSHGLSPFGASYGPAYFVVYYPDGSKAWYGSQPDSKSRTTYAISSWQDHNGIKIDYEYLQSYNVLYISKIKYGYTTNSPNTHLNEIRFNYVNLIRSGLGLPQQAFIGDISFIRDKVLTQIEILSNNFRFRRYVLDHYKVSGYPRLNYIQEYNGDLTEAHSSINFDYNTTPNTVSYQGVTTIGLENVDQLNAKTMSLDLTGNGKLDYLIYPNEKDKFWLFKDVQGGDYTNPYAVTTGAFKTIFPVTSLNHQGKVLAGQNLGIVQESGTNNVNFKVYSNGTVNPIYYQYTKTWYQPTYTEYTTPDDHVQKRVPFEYLSGDFNGDGLTEVLAVGKPYTSRYCYYHGNCNDPDPCDNNFVNIDDCIDNFQLSSGQLEENQNTDKNTKSGKGKKADDKTLKVSKPFNFQSFSNTTCSYSCYSSTSNYKSVYKIDLKRDVASNYVNYAGNLQEHLSGNYKLLSGDFNGDGKTDIMHITAAKKAYVYTFKANGDMELLWSMNLDASYNPDPGWPFLLGDYNGDGKTDFIHPTAKDSKNFVIGLSTGTRFQTGVKLMTFAFKVSTWNGTELKMYNYIPLDANGDGKTDIIDYRTITYNDGTNGSQNIIIYKSEGLSSHGNTTDIRFRQAGFKNVVGNVRHYPIPIFLSSNEENKSLEFATISHKWIRNFSFNSDHREDALLRGVSNNGMTYEIDYQNLDPSLYREDGYQFYVSGYDELYPNLDIRTAPNVKVVTEFRRLSDDSPTVKKLFAYEGGIYNSAGLGFLGFKGIARSNWHEESNERIFTTSKYNAFLRGALIAEYSQVLDFTFSIPSSNYITKATYDIGHSIATNKVFTSWVNSKLLQDALRGVNINTTYQYDAYYSPTVIQTDYFGHGSKQVNYSYANNTGSDYYIGRAVNRIETTTIGTNSFSAEQQFVYSGYRLSQIKSKGNNTTFNTVSFEYDQTFGNVIRQITTPNGEASRIIEYEYDNAGRFMTKHTDVEGLESYYQYNVNTGTLTSMTNAFGQTTTYSYDKWNREVKVTDYLGNKTMTAYEETSNRYKVTVNADDGSAMVSQYDQLQRLSELHEKDVLGQWIKTKYIYDKFDRITKVSEPYIGPEPAQWNETSYDFYGRPKQQVLNTGRTINITYNGLTTTVNDGVKNVSAATSAMGLTSSVTDPGGTINYTYHGNGDLKTANYEGVVVSVEIDGWGRRTQLTDPSAGTYNYEYNGFGELTKEITPKGVTEFSYSAIGKLSQKRILGDHTDMTINYNYDAISKLPVQITMTSADGNNSNYVYSYDSHLRPQTVTENNPFAQFKKSYTYDSFGRVATENYEATLLSNGRTSRKKISNTYQNGGLAQINSYGDNTVLWKLNSLNARGQITDADFGPIKSLNTYDAYGYLTSIKANKASDNTNLMTLGYNFDVQRGTLNSRTNSMFSWSETFGYDNLDRLITFNDNNGAGSQAYDTFGRITENTLVGTYNYTGNSFQVSDIDLNAQGNLYYQQNNQQQVAYNAFKSPHEIKEQGKDHIRFQYNAFEGRSHRFYGGFEEDILQRNNRKHYAFDGSMEITHDKTTDTTVFISFLGGDAYTAPVVWRTQSTASVTNEGYHHLHRDHLNSIVLITGENGVVEEKRHFDAWGNTVKLTDGNGNALQNFKIIDRGYTGHEHLESAGLIHMNGRLYDPRLRRFLSPDNYIQDISNTQNFNRYGYVLNNPLMYWDPSGEQTESEGGGTLTWIASFIASSIGASWEAIKTWDWEGFGDAFARPFREAGRWVKKQFKSIFGIKDKPTIKEVPNPQSLTMDPLARSGLDYTPSATVGVGQADTGLRIAKNVMDFNVGFLNGFVNGGKSTLNFVRSLGTAQGWKNIGQGFVNFAEMANIYSVDGLIIRTQLGMAVNDYVTNIPNMSVYELGHDSGFLFEKVLEIALVSRGTSLTVNAVTKGKTLFNFTKTAGAHMDEVGRMIPVQTLDDIIKAPTHVLKDPQGTKALMHYSQMWKNGKLYNVEVLYNKASNTIMHFKYTQKGLGPLQAIPK